MFSKDLNFLPTIVGDLLEKTEKVEIKSLIEKEDTIEAVDIDVSNFDEGNWWKDLFDEEDGFDSYGSIMYLETQLTFEDILYFSTEEEIKQLINRYDRQQLKEAFFELYLLYNKIVKNAVERAKLLEKGKK